MAKPPPTRASIKITKTIPYRGTSKLWSNRYFFDAVTSLTTTSFNDLADGLTAQEKTIFSTEMTFVEAIGYDAGSEVPVFSKSIASVTPTFSGGTNPRAQGDSVILARFSTAQRTSKNHPIYLFKYWHGAFTDGLSQSDDLMGAQHTAAAAVASALVTGINDGTAARALCGPYGAVAQGSLVSTHVMHRDFLN